DGLGKDLAMSELSGGGNIGFQDMVELSVEGSAGSTGFQHDIGGIVGVGPTIVLLPAELVDVGPGQEVLKGEFGIARQVFENTRDLEIIGAIDTDHLPHGVLVTEEVFGDMFREHDPPGTGKRGLGVAL